MTTWMINCMKADYDWSHNKEYRTCPFCSAWQLTASKEHGKWTIRYTCNTIIAAEYNNHNYGITFARKCAQNGKYNNIDISDRDNWAIQRVVKNN